MGSPSGFDTVALLDALGVPKLSLHVVQKNSTDAEDVVTASPLATAPDAAGAPFPDATRGSSASSQADGGASVRQPRTSSSGSDVTTDPAAAPADVTATTRSAGVLNFQKLAALTIATHAGLTAAAATSTEPESTMSPKVGASADAASRFAADVAAVVAASVAAATAPGATASPAADACAAAVAAL
ncbi:hypothetical protein HK405_013400, partial [Cladochytrium tenue]